MSVQAMFYVKEVRHMHTGGPEAIAEIKMSAAFGTYLNGLPEEGNKDWSKWTPCGEFTMTVTNPAAIDKFSVGQVKKITIEDAEKTA